jgi:predicted glycosyltransferase
MSRASRSPRVLFYSHDKLGLGHVGRTLSLARELLDKEPEAEVLVVSGSPIPEGSARPGLRLLPLAPMIKTSSFAARYSSFDLASVIAYRSRQLLGAVRFFSPDVIVVDHAPLGMSGELAPVLRYVRIHLPETDVVLGLDDILDEPKVVRRTWERQGAYDALAELYDRVLIYGQRSHFPLDRAYDFPEPVRAKTRFVGYVSSGDAKSDDCLLADELRSAHGLSLGAPLLLATVGGGSDGVSLIQRTIAALPQVRRQVPELEALIVTGPLMSERDRRDVARCCAHTEGVRVVRFLRRFTSAMAAADVIVSMGGYDTLTEILSLQRQAVIVPRIQPRSDQLIRARVLARRGLVRMIEPERLTTARLGAAISAALATGNPVMGKNVALGGGERAVAEIRALFMRRIGVEDSDPSVYQLLSQTRKIDIR